MKLFRLRITILELMCIVAGCAIISAVLRTEAGRAISLFVGAPLIGALLQRARGGRGLLGGAIGGVLGFWVYGFVAYMLTYINLGRIPTDYLAPYMIFSLLGFFGALFGFAIGSLSWWLRLDARQFWNK